MATLAETLAQALRHHGAGNLQLAEQLYRQILQTVPGCADAHHLLGVIAYQSGRHGQAVASIRQALALNADASAYWTNLGVALDALGQLDQAVVAYREALRLQPDAADAHSNLGNALQRLGQTEEAIAHGRLALRHRPQYPEAYNNLGNALLDAGKLGEAATSFENALRLNPGYAEAVGNLGNVHARQGRFEEAIRCYQQAVRLNPSIAGPWNNLGLAFEHVGNLEDAIRCHQRAVSLQPEFADAWNNLGIALKRQGKLDDASLAYEQALQLDPGNTKALINLGNVHRDQGQFEEALACYERGLSNDAGFAEAHFNRALLWLLQGRWSEGWQEYEWRWQTNAFPRPAFTQPRWDGSALDGRTILLHAEQGLGDTLQFVRYASLVKARGGRVLLQCQPLLQRLLAAVAMVDVVIPQTAPLPAFDVEAPLLSLPGIFQTTPDTVPRTVPYLYPDAALVETWRRDLNHGKRFKVGITWQGNPSNSADWRRSIALTCFAPLARVEGVQLISLQKGPGTEQLQAMAGQFEVLDLGKRLDQESGPFMDAAAIMMSLDLVIVSDSAVAHLAGALGVEVWVALPAVPDWRWLLQREDCPWYPTMRLFRQTRHGHWDDVFERIAVELSVRAENAN